MNSNKNQTWLTLFVLIISALFGLILLFTQKYIAYVYDKSFL